MGLCGLNGLFAKLLCLSHKDTCQDGAGNLVIHRAGMVLIAFEEDADEPDNRDDTLASGTVEPVALGCMGSCGLTNLAKDRNRASRAKVSPSA